MTCQLSGPVLRGRHRQMAERVSAAREVKIASREPFEMVGEEVDTTAMLIGVYIYPLRHNYIYPLRHNYF
jgi:hypothetical protein